MSHLRQGFRIESWTVDPESNLLHRDDSSVLLEPRQMDLLVFLAENQGRTVSKDEIFEAVWKETYVTDSTLWKTISELRQALEEDPKKPKLIVTVARRGYRLDGKVEPASELEVSGPEAETPTSPGNRWLFGAGIAVGLLIVLLVAWSVSHDSPGSADTTRDYPTVLLATLDNRTGNELLDGTLEVVLQNRLIDSGSVHLVASLRIQDALRLMREPEDTEISSEMALRVAQRDGEIDRIVTGRIDHVGSLYQVSLQLIDGYSQELLGSADRQTDSLEDVLPEANELAAWLVGELAQGAPADKESVPERVTTSSLEALRLYTRGVETYLSRPKAQAIPYFEQATEIDPEFASAYLMLAFSRVFADSQDPSRIHEGVEIFSQRFHGGFHQVITQETWAAMQRAMELKDLTSHAERAFIQGCYYDFRSDFEKAASFFLLAADLDPEHRWAGNNLMAAALELHDLELYAKGRVAQARIIPGNLHDQITFGGSLVDHGFLELAAEPLQRARSAAARLTAEDLSNEDIVYMLSFLDTYDAWNPWRLGQYAEAVQETDRVATRIEDRIAQGLDQDQALHFLAALYLMQGRLEMARELLRRFDLYNDSYSVSSPATLLAFLYESADPLGPEVPTRGVSPGLRPVARLLFDPDSWSEETREPPRSIKRAFPEAVQPLLAILKDRDPSNRSETVQRLKTLVDNLDFRIFPPDPEFVMRWLMARELDALGRADEALQVREEIVADRNRTMAGGAIIWQKTALELAASYQERGRHPEAEELISDLRNMLQFGDPDHPLLKALGHLQGV